MDQIPKPFPDYPWKEWGDAACRLLRLPMVFAVVHVLSMSLWIELEGGADAGAVGLVPFALMVAVSLFFPIGIYWGAYLRLRWSEMVTGSALASALVIVPLSVVPPSPGWAVEFGGLVWFFLGPAIVAAVGLRLRS